VRIALIIGNKNPAHRLTLNRESVTLPSFSWHVEFASPAKQTRLGVHILP